MLSIPAALITEKNKLYGTGAFLELLEVQMASGTTLRIVNNNDDITWSGYTWSKFRFEGGNQEESSDGEIPSVEIKVSNVSRIVQGHLEASDTGLVGDTVVYRLVHSDNLTETTPAITGTFTITDVEATDEWVTFTLGMENFFLNRFPRNVYRRNICRYQPHQTDVCSYANSASCDRKFSTCISLGRESVFGGQPAIPGGAWDAS